MSLRDSASSASRYFFALFSSPEAEELIFLAASMRYFAKLNCASGSGSALIRLRYSSTEDLVIGGPLPARLPLVVAFLRTPARFIEEVARPNAAPPPPVIDELGASEFPILLKLEAFEVLRCSP